MNQGQIERFEARNNEEYERTELKLATPNCIEVSLTGQRKVNLQKIIFKQFPAAYTLL